MTKGVNVSEHKNLQRPLSKVARKDRPKFNGEEIRAALRAYDRAPFIDVLVEWIGCGPGPEAIADFAEKHPDKYVVAMASLARIAGFSEKTETRIDVNVDIRKLSDSQLEDRLADFAAKMGLPKPSREIIEGERARHAPDEARHAPAEAEIVEIQQPDADNAGKAVPNLDTDTCNAPQQPSNDTQNA